MNLIEEFFAKSKRYIGQDRDLYKYATVASTPKRLNHSFRVYRFEYHSVTFSIYLDETILSIIRLISIPLVALLEDNSAQVTGKSLFSALTHCTIRINSI